MSDQTTTDTAVETESDETENEVSLNWYYSPAGVPVVIAEDPNVFNDIEQYFGSELPVCFIQSQEQVKLKLANGSTEEVVRPCFYKLVQNLVGWSISKVQDIDLGFMPIKPSASFNLPPIPWTLLYKVDAFLRRVHQEVGTEAIVLLTFDPTVTNDDGEYTSEGWGVLVPKQTNSAGHCNYDPISAHDDRPDQAVVVGSIHSHPNMPAYASDTDHADQADFDGIHITFGWFGQGPTQYYIEMTYQGQHYELNTDDAFCPIDHKSVDGIEDWVKRVERHNPNVPKAKTTSTGGTSTASNTTATSDLSLVSTQDYYRDQRFVALALSLYSPHPFITNLLDVATNVVVCVLVEDEKTCPMCGAHLTAQEIEAHKCVSCFNYLMPHTAAKHDKTLIVREIIKKRDELKLPSEDLQNTASNGVAIWYREKTSDKTFKQGVVSYQEPILSSAELLNPSTSPKA